MASLCTKFDKVLVGPNKTCDTCELGSFTNPCQYRIQQEGVLKKYGRKVIWPFGTGSKSLTYQLNKDGNYHLCDKIIEIEGMLALPTLTQDEFRLIKNERQRCRKDKVNTRYAEIVRKRT